MNSHSPAGEKPDSHIEARSLLSQDEANHSIPLEAPPLARKVSQHSVPYLGMPSPPQNILMDIPVYLNSVSKSYRQILGINNITLFFEKGITGVLGPNGAGKSTMLKVIAGLVRPSFGEVYLYGRDPRNDVSVLSRLGYCPEHDAFYPGMTGKEFVAHFLRVRGVEQGKALKMAGTILKKLDMGKKMDRPIRTYSRGMKQKIKIANAVVHDPDIIILDEPLQGTDPEVRHLLIENIKAWGRAGKTIIVSSHILKEIEKLTKRVVLINEGRVFAVGEMDKIRELMTNRPLTIRITPRNPQGVRRLASFLLQETSVSSIAIDGIHITVYTSDARRFYAISPRLIKESGVPIDEFISMDDNLESLYYYLITQSRW